jgi:hypothetical protein
MLTVALGPSRQHQSLTVFPLLSPSAPELPYSLLADALSDGALRITEVGSGSVPELYAVNSGDATILVLDGEQLVGAKQNRTTNRSLLLPAGSETKIPVSCMEQGRWRFDSDHFKATDHSSPTGVRRKAREVEARYARGGAAAPAEALSNAQGEVWSAIAEHEASLGARSGTSALNDLYSTRSSDIERWVEAFPAEPGQVGLLAFLGDRPVGMDVIGCHSLYARVHRRLLAGSVMDALAAWDARGAPGGEEAQAFLDRVREARRVDSPTVGAGRYGVLDGSVIGGELTEAGTVVHLSAFPGPTQGTNGGPRYLMGDPIAPPSLRRRRE